MVLIVQQVTLSKTAVMEVFPLLDWKDYPIHASFGLCS